MSRLSKEERAELEQRLRDDDAEGDDDYEVEIGTGDNYTRVPYSKAKSWLQKTFGIDLDEQPQDDTPEDKGKGKGGGKDSSGPGEVRRFAGRRVS